LQIGTDKKGLFWGFISYALWGFFPLYWKLLGHRQPLEILSHRMVWSFVFYALMFTGFSYRQFPSLISQSKRDLKLSALAATLLTVNWGIYIYAVNSGHVLEGSLAYFINPILNVAVGVLFFKEPFPLALKLSVAFAALGVLAKIWYTTGFPWISLVLAFTFCAYGVTKKLLRIPAMTSSVLEGAFGFLPAAVAIFYFSAQDPSPISTSTWFLFVMGGVVTGLPLFLFSYAAQRVPYSIMGMLQFIAPSLQFLVAVAVYHENFGFHDFVAFGFIWIGIFFYMIHQALKKV
jgi:chloramphenicol-sensitive protein RarD